MDKTGNVIVAKSWLPGFWQCHILGDRGNVLIRSPLYASKQKATRFAMDIDRYFIKQGVPVKKKVRK